MKITIDEGIFNKAISLGKLELADWLLTQGCPTDELCYLQNFDTKILNWLNYRSMPVPKSCLSSVIDRTGDLPVINWFLEKGVLIDAPALLSCIKTGRNELFNFLSKKANVVVGIDGFNAAIMSENVTMLNYLKSIGCKTDETSVEIAMKFKKKESLKWLVMNDMF